MEDNMSRIYATLLLPLFVIILSCADSSTTGPPTARFELYLQDGPVDFDSVIVTIEEIAIRSTLYDFPDSISGWNMIYNTGESFDLAGLRNGRRELLIQNEVPVGYIGSSKITFSSSRVVENGVSHDLNFLSGYSAISEGVIQVSKDRTASALVDINLFSSILYNPDSGLYYFSPEFIFIDIDSTGGMFGYTNPSADIFLFSVADDDTTGFTASEPDSNYFGFFGLPEGVYNLYLFAHDTLYGNWEVVDLHVLPNNIIELGTIDLPEE
jgi:hypothetical protein